MKTHETATPVRAFDRAYINGQFTTPHGSRVVDLVNPTDNKVIGKVTMADEIDTRKAIGAATLGRGNLGDNFQRRNLVAFELEKESKVNGTAGKISNQVAGDNYYPVLLFARDRLAGVFVFGRSTRLPLLDRRSALVGVSLILHDGIFSETLRERSAVIFVRCEVGRDGCWQI
jgi:hypothetical protein